MADIIGTDNGETLNGTGDPDFIDGRGGADTLNGLGGNDIIVGGTGADLMNGGLGDDWFFVDDSGDQVAEAVGEGNDRVFAGVSFALAAGAEIETLSTDFNDGTGAIDLTGNEFVNFIVGNNGVNTLTGGGGNDTLVGRGGNDILIGGIGGDLLDGGTGDDWFFVDSASDRVLEANGEGNDRVFASASFALEAGSHVEMITTDNNFATTAINLTGNAFSQYIYGNAGANEIDSGGGGDVMYGFEGDDRFYTRNAADRVVEFAGGGFDRVLAAASFTLEAGSEVEMFTTVDNLSTVAINLTGNALSQYMYGNAGANEIDGGGGGDVMYGFEGDDRFYIRNIADRVVESAGGGFDRVLAAASFTLEAGSQVEMFTTVDNLSTAAINLTGNELSQYMYGNAGANEIDGGGGGDVMYGFEGDDRFYTRNAADRVVEFAGGGNDRVLAGASFTLEAGSEVEMFTTVDNLATTAINLTGNELSQYMYGNAGSNTLDGGGGGDVMTGFEGDDFYIARAAGDRAVEAAGGGTDRVLATVSFALEAGSEVELLTTIDNLATTAINLTGNALAQYLYGNAGANTLDGGGGGDVMTGFGGDDFFVVRNASDRAVEAAGEGTDRVFATTSFTLEGGSHVELLTTIDNLATTAINLTGNELDQYLYGNAGANRLDGKAGLDVLTGFGGADVFVFTTALGGGNVDSVADFAAGTDRIELAGAAGQPFSALASGNLRAEAFVIGAAAVAADDYLIYNSATGALLYDADGNGAGAAVQFATLQTGLSLTAADFQVAGPANNPVTVTSGGTASIAENSAASTIVYQASATDADGDRITYTLSGADASLLTIDAVTGAVRLVNPADFETKSTYNFNVVASDSASSTPRAVQLTITDVTEGGGSTPIINETAGPNNSRNNAQVVDRNGFAVANNPNLFNDDLPSATITGSISDHADKDFFSITLQAGELLVLDVDGTNGLDSHLRLFAANGNEIGDNDDLIVADPGSDPPFGHNTDSQIRFRAGTSGTYYFSIEAFQGDNADSSGAYQLHVSIGPQATSAQIAQEDIDALVSGLEWPSANVSYSFPNEVDDYPSPFGDPEDPETASFSPFTGTQQTAVQLMLQHISTLTQLTFTQFFNDNEGAAQLRYAMTNATGAAHAYLPGNSDEAGSAWFNKTDFNAPAKGNYAWMGILHETGHALGLKHGHEFPVAISGSRDSVEYSVMTYRSFPGQDLSNGGGYTNEDWGYPQTLMMYDIAALQQIYGANYNTNATNTTYRWNPTTGELSINNVGQGAPGNGDGITSASENRVLMTIWDGGGTDTYDLSLYGGGTTIDLRPGEWSTTSSTQLANLRDSAGGPSFARGNIANALMHEGNTASLIENAIGSGGADTFFANQVANLLTGGGGADTFRWASASDAGTGVLADTIADLARGSDLIHLGDIDANSGTGANDAFAFIGTSAFHNVAGELRYQAEGANARIQADLDGNGLADMEIIVSNHTILASTDFIL